MSKIDLTLPNLENFFWWIFSLLEPETTNGHKCENVDFLNIKKLK